MIKPCSCKHEGQDSLHGTGNRVHTEGVEGKVTCTVCGEKKGSPLGGAKGTKK